MKRKKQTTKKNLKDLVLQTAGTMNLLSVVKNEGLVPIVKNIRKKLDSDIFSDPVDVVQDCILEYSL